MLAGKALRHTPDNGDPRHQRYVAARACRWGAPHRCACLTKQSGIDNVYLSTSRETIVSTETTTDQIAFRYHSTDSATGVTRETVKHLAGLLGVDENEVIHRALHDLAARLLPRYEADDGPLTDEQMREIEKAVPQGIKRTVRSSLF